MAAVEAGSCGLPVITSEIYGLTDAVEEGVTGLMHPPGDVSKIIEYIDLLIRNQNIRKSFGINAMSRSQKNFLIN